MAQSWVSRVNSSGLSIQAWGVPVVVLEVALPLWQIGPHCALFCHCHWCLKQTWSSKMDLSDQVLTCFRTRHISHNLYNGISITVQSAGVVNRVQLCKHNECWCKHSMGVCSTGCKIQMLVEFCQHWFYVHVGKVSRLMTKSVKVNTLARHYLGQLP